MSSKMELIDIADASVSCRQTTVGRVDGIGTSLSPRARRCGRRRSAQCNSGWLVKPGQPLHGKRLGATAIVSRSPIREH